MTWSPGINPSAVCEALLVGLSVLKRQAGSGVLQTLKRFAGEKPNLDAIDLHVGAGGLPAMLVCYFGGKLTPTATSQQRWSQAMDLAVICCASNFSTREERMAGSAPSINPGIEDLMDWAGYYGARAAAGVDRVRQVHVKEHSFLRYEPGRYVGLVAIEAVRTLDIYDEATGITLQKLGIVHDPIDKDKLFEDDNITPRSSQPAAIAGGVADLS